MFSKCFHFQDVKLKWFQARVLHRLLPTRKYLFDRRIIQSPTCTVCNDNPQTIQHLLWNCKFTKKFWTDFELLLKTKCSHCSSLDLSEELVLFGCKENFKSDFCFDFLLILAKFYVYKSYLGNKPLYIECYVRNLKISYTDMKYLAYVNSKQHTFYTTWETYKEVVE